MLFLFSLVLKHCVNFVLQIKLGPALKICNAVEAMQEELKQN